MSLEITRQELLKQAIYLNKLYATTRNQEYKDQETRIRRIIVELDAFAISSGSQTLQDVTDNGSTTTNIIDTAGTKSDYFQLDTAATPTLQPGMFGWNDSDGTANLRLKGNNVTLQVGQETVARVVNKTGADLLESQYKVVRVRIASEGGSQGQRLAVVLAQGNNDPDSATTLGLVTENIANNQEGFITVFGNVNGINTTGSLQGETWVDGDVLYLSPTTPGSLTKVKPIAPQHTVIVGYVLYAHNNQGKIFVKVDNGYELDELHNVRITSVANSDLLQYDSTLQVWKNVAASVAVPTPTLAQVTTAGNTTTNAITVGGLTVDTNTLFVDATNNRVGIGTAAPNQPLHVVGRTRIASSTGTSLHLYNDGSTSLIDSLTNGNAAHDLRISAQNISFYSGASYGTVYAKLFNTGNFALGSNPTDAGFKLDVNGTVRVSGNTSISAGNLSIFTTNTPRRINVQQGSGSICSTFGMYDGGGSLQAAFGLETVSTNALQMASTASIRFYSGSIIGNAVTEPTNERMRLFSTGNLGINTTTDAGYKLDVNGGARINGNLLLGLTAGSGNLFAGRVYSKVFRIPDGDETYLLINWSGYTNNQITFGTTQTTALTLNAKSTGYTTIPNGNVLIGTTTDSGQKLQVIGSVFIKGSDSLSSTKVFEVQNGAGASIMDFRNATYAFFGCGQGGGSNSGFIFNYSNTSYTQFAGYNYGAGSGSYKPILMDTDTGGRNQGIFVNFGVTTNTPPNSDTEFGVLGRTSDSTTYISRFRNSGNTDKFAIRADGALFTNTLQGYSGTLNIPTNPPGSTNITITNGIITNVA